jgi:hypothetical protein
MPVIGKCKQDSRAPVKREEKGHNVYTSIGLKKYCAPMVNFEESPPVELIRVLQT